MSMDRAELHRIIDTIPEDKVSAIGRLLKDAIDIAVDDPVRRSLASAPLDDEPLTDEEQARINSADEDLKTGQIRSMDEVKRELGI